MTKAKLMRRSTSTRNSANGGPTDKKSTKSKATKSAATKLSKLRSSTKIIVDTHHINNKITASTKNGSHLIAYTKNNRMPVYNIIARRHKVCKVQKHFLTTVNKTNQQTKVCCCCCFIHCALMECMMFHASRKRMNWFPRRKRSRLLNSFFFFQIFYWCIERYILYYIWSNDWV